MKYADIVIVKRWIPILKEYEQTKAKITPRPFKFVKNLCQAHHISKKELCRYYRKWIEGGKTPECPYISRAQFPFDHDDNINVW